MEKNNTLQTISKKLIFVLITVLSILILTAGYLSFKYQESSIRQEKYNELKAIADLKASQIENWLHERNADVKVVTHSPFFIDGIDDWLQDKANAQQKQDIIRRLKPVQKELGYKNVLLAQENGDILLSANDSSEEIDDFLKQKIDETFLKREIVNTDIYLSQKENIIYFDIIAPIINSNNKTIAVLIFRRDLNHFLYPLIQKWPTPSKSAETVILRVENDSVVFLNELRHTKNTTLKLKIPLTRTDVPAVQAALGRTGLFEGLDYRGVKVLSDIRIIPGINWIMLSKVDKSEIYSALYVTGGITAGFTILLILICGIALAFFYKARQKNIFMELYNKEKELWGQQEKFRVTMDSLGEGVITLDVKGKLQYMNILAEEMTGWKLREARGRELHDIYPVKNEVTGQRENNILEKIYKQGIVKELANHTLLISKSGKEIPVMDTGAPIYDSDGAVIGIVIAFQDETEKRHQKKLLAQSEARYRSLVDNALVGVYESTADGKVLYGNKAVIEMLGFKSLEEFLSAPAIMHHKNPKRRDELISQLKQHGKVENFENEVITNDGREINILVSAKLASNVLSGMVLDVTARKLTEEALRASDELLQSAINILPVGLWIFDAKGKIVISSAAAQRIWAGVRYVDVDQLGEYKGWRTNSGKLIEAHEWAGARALEKGEISIEEEVEIECFDGTHKIILDTAVPLRKSDGSICGAITMNQDITERKLAEKELEESNERFKRLVSNLNDVVWTASIDNTQLFDVNDSFESIYGISIEEYKKHPNLWIDTVHPEDRAIAEASGKELIEQGKSQAEYRIVRPDGRIVWLLDRKSLIYDEDGKAVQMGGIAKDITLHKLAEKELIDAKEKAEEMSRLKSSFLANMSHELRTPLIGILGFSEILKDELEDSEHKDWVETIHKSGNRLSETLNLILDLSKLESEKMDFKIAMVDVVKETNEIMGLFSKIAERKGLYLKAAFNCPSLMIKVDVRAYRSILNNLINNAIKFTNKGGVLVEVNLIDNYTVIKVKDTGIGISKKDHEIIFAEFRQVSEGLGRNFEGTGLGLNITKKLVNKFGGEITVESELDKGSTFMVKLPHLPGDDISEEKTAVKPPVQRPVSNEKKIKPLALLVDDDPLVYPVLLRYFEGRIQLETIAEGEAAIKICKEKKYDMIFMDINLKQGLDGKQVTGEIRKLAGYENIPIIAITAYAMNGDEQEFLAAGCSHYISKPFNKQDILNLVDEVMHKKD